MSDFVLPSHCAACGAYLQGGATIHAESCPFYPLSYRGIIKGAAMTCLHCDEPVGPEEQHPHFHQPMHVECGFRNTVGSVAHIQRRCGCYVKGSTESDPPGMSARQAAKAAMEAHQALCRRRDMASRN